MLLTQILYHFDALHRATYDPSLDTFRVEFLVGPTLIMGLIFNYGFNFSEILWSFSIWLESVAIFPQLFMLQRTGEAETITTHYIAALGIYRALYIPNWIYRSVTARVSFACCVDESGLTIRGCTSSVLCTTLTWDVRHSRRLTTQVLVRAPGRPNCCYCRASADRVIRRLFLRLFHQVSIPSVGMLRGSLSHLTLQSNEGPAI